MPEPRVARQPGPLLEFLMSAWPGVKRKQALIWLKYKAVMVNDRTTSQFNYPLKNGDVVTIREKGQAAPGTRVGSHLKIRHEDPDIIVIEKPAGLLSMASDRERERNAYYQLVEHVRGGDPLRRERVWIVHRLDRDTSGLMVFAKTEAAKRTLQQQWEKAEKHYFAVVKGAPPEQKGTFTSHLDESDPLYVRSAPEGPKTRLSTTHYRVIKKGQLTSLLELTLGTGRRHQIRVHLSDAGCPVVGDKKYGAESNPIRRLGLHANILRFAHPRTGAPMAFECPLPGELGKLVQAKPSTR